MQYNNDSREGIEFKSFYPVNEFPYVGILDPRTGEQMKQLDKALTVDEFSTEVVDFLETFSLDPSRTNPLVPTPKRKKDPATMTEEDQIAYAMRQSLGEADISESDKEIEIVEDFTSKGKSVTIDTKPELSSEKVAEPGQEQEPDTDEDEKPLRDTEKEPTEEDIFSLIQADNEPEPEMGPGITRIQFRLSDGTRIVRRFKASDLVRKMFGVVKAIVDSVGESFFSLTSERKKLISMLDQTIEEAGLKNSSILVEILD